MNKEEFLEYIDEDFGISGEAYRLISNILDFVGEHFPDEYEQYRVLSELLGGTIGLSDSEIKQVYL